MHQLSNMIGEY